MLLIWSGFETLDAFGASRPEGVDVVETSMVYVEGAVWENGGIVTACAVLFSRIRVLGARDPPATVVVSTSVLGIEEGFEFRWLWRGRGNVRNRIAFSARRMWRKRDGYVENLRSRGKHPLLPV